MRLLAEGPVLSCISAASLHVYDDADDDGDDDEEEPEEHEDLDDAEFF